MQTKIRIGTRGSPLALKQADELRARLSTQNAMNPDDFEIVIIKTSGDQILDRALADAGGKELFTKEIEEALLDGRIDMAVHSSKDMPTILPDGLEIGCFLPREDVRDALISLSKIGISDLPQNAKIGTASLRRAAQIRNIRPDLEVVLFRGNVQTRLRKLEEGVADATFLAHAGLKRLGMDTYIAKLIEPEEMLPAVGQGAICVEIRINDPKIGPLVAKVHDADTGDCVDAERAFLKELDGSCRTPIAGLAELDGTSLKFRGQVLSPDGVVSHKIEKSGARKDAATIGQQAGAEIKALLPPDFFAEH